MNRISHLNQLPPIVSITIEGNGQTYVFKFRREYAQQIFDMLPEFENNPLWPEFSENETAVVKEIIRRLRNVGNKKMKKLFGDDCPDANGETGPPEGY